MACRWQIYLIDEYTRVKLEANLCSVDALDTMRLLYVQTPKYKVGCEVLTSDPQRFHVDPVPQLGERNWTHRKS